MNRSKIVVLGLCAKRNPRGGVFPPLSPRSRSGRFLRAAIDAVATDPVEVVFDNILPGCVLDATGAERNPVATELIAPLRRHWSLRDRSVSAVIALGSEARKAFDALPPSLIGDLRLWFLAHPSYMMRRPLHERDAFERALRAALAAPDAQSHERSPEV